MLFDRVGKVHAELKALGEGVEEVEHHEEAPARLELPILHALNVEPNLFADDAEPEEMVR